MAKYYPNVFSRFKFGNVEIKNRIEIAPAVPSLASGDGFATRELIEYYKSLAKGGAGIVTIGDSAIDFEYAKDHQFQLNMGDDNVISGLNMLVEAIHRYGAKASIELVHPGRGAQPRFIGGRSPLAVSQPPPAERGTLAQMMIAMRSHEVTVMTQKHIDTVINRYVEACDRCLQVGFEMVMIHGAHGQLPAQFVSPYTNKRTDRYGGSLQNRARFVIQLLDAIRGKLGNRLAIEYRISAEEIVPHGMKVEDTIEFIRMIQDKIDLIHVSRGILTNPLANQRMIQPLYFPHGLNVSYAEKIKKAINIPVVAVGSIDMDMADRIIGEGKCDVVAMARNNMADTEYVNKNRDGEFDEITPCIRCNECCTAPQGLPIRCAVNPVLGREVEYAYIRPADKKKKVVVVGGGPAGMEAAIVAASRGHSVTLYEKKGNLGGAFVLATMPDFKADMKRFLDWIVGKTQRTPGVNLKLATEATADIIGTEKPDILIVAIGAEPIIPDSVLGIHKSNVVLASDVIAEEVLTGKIVVVVGAGLTGCETALYLSRQSKAVTVIDMVSEREIAQDANFINKLGLMELLIEQNVQFRTEIKLNEITNDGVMVIDKHGKRFEIPADTIVLSLGFKACAAYVEAFQELAPHVYVIGDCAKPRNLRHAIHDGFNVAVEI